MSLICPYPAKNMKVNMTTKGRGSPIVFFHGWGFDHHVWDFLIPCLVDHHQIYLVDLPGFGETPNMDWEDFKEALIKQLPSEFALVGWSMGGLVATRFAVEELKPVTHLMSVSSSPRLLQEKNWPGIDRRVFNVFYRNCAKNPARVLKQFVKLQVQNDDSPLTPPHKKPTKKGLLAGLELLHSLDLRQNLHSLTAPACFLFGRLDAITPYRTIEKMKVLYPHFKYVLIHNAAHAPFISHTEEFIGVLENFLRETSSSR